MYAFTPSFNPHLFVAQIHGWVKRRNWKQFINYPDRYYRNGPTKPVPGTTAHQAIMLQDPNSMSDNDIIITYKWIHDCENGKVPKGTPVFQWVGGDYPDVPSTSPSPIPKKRTRSRKSSNAQAPKKVRIAADAQKDVGSSSNGKSAPSMGHRDDDDLEYIDLSGVKGVDSPDTESDIEIRPKPVCVVHVPFTFPVNLHKIPVETAPTF